MTLATLLRQTVTVIHREPGEPDETSDRPLEEVDRADYPAWLEQTKGDELTEDRQTEVSDWLLILEPDADISAVDLVVDEDGQVFEVVAPPAGARTPRGVHHLEARCRLI